MKKTILIVLGVMGLFFAQAQETAPPPRPDSPLITAAKNEHNNPGINFNSFSWTPYSNTTDFDFNRQTSLEKLQEGVAGTWYKVMDLPITVTTIEGETFSIQGTATPVSVSNVTIRFGNQNRSARRLVVLEEYTLSQGGSEIAKYTNTYYSFFDGDQLLFEVASKERVFYSALSEHYDCITYNMEDYDEELDISLTLTPNPASVQAVASFVLWQPGYMTLTVTNSTANVNNLIFAGNLESGENEITIPTDKYTTGTYNVTANFGGRTFSTTLIIQ